MHAFGRDYLTRKADGIRHRWRKPSRSAWGGSSWVIFPIEQANKPAHADSEYTQQGRRGPLYKTPREPVYLPAKQIIPGSRESDGSQKIVLYGTFYVSYPGKPKPPHHSCNRQSNRQNPKNNPPQCSQHIRAKSQPSGPFAIAGRAEKVKEKNND